MNVTDRRQDSKDTRQTTNEEYEQKNIMKGTSAEQGKVMITTKRNDIKGEC